ncbi:putative pectate lyase F [Fusarium oxysporum f. sp. albedinis]|nr:putative pectate lyase F [Fusarium oxysporum f. sp. albedinis]
MFLSALILRAASGEGSKVGGDHVAWLVSQHASSSFIVTMAFDEANRFESMLLEQRYYSPCLMRSVKVAYFSPKLKQTVMTLHCKTHNQGDKEFLV